VSLGKVKIFTSVVNKKMSRKKATNQPRKDIYSPQRAQRAQRKDGSNIYWVSNNKMNDYKRLFYRKEGCLATMKKLGFRGKIG
jgi:hypothetical protein